MTASRPTIPSSARYLGDGVYAWLEMGDEMLVLATSNGLETQNIIYLEREIVESLKQMELFK
jgi:hypothetical protein